ncbi:MAG: GIY-YIG nuclease family protein [Gemmatimonadota bacterium]|nr:MAG: GIY-YIG nuclease family protein [Gemmatimonadota bacterium]
MDNFENQQEIFSLLRKKIPRGTGVYLFSDQNGEIMYVGKSLNLRQRVSSYFRTDMMRVEYRTREMISNIGDVDFYETDSELLALLLEDALIKDYQPRHNVRQQQYLGYQYILLTEGPYPTCRMMGKSDDPGQGQTFGPYKSRFFVKDLLYIIRRFVGLRSCEETVPTRFSLNHEFGYCTGPCRGKISPGGYARIVERVVEFLRGNETYAVGKLTEAMEEASLALQFEKAEEFKGRIEFCERFCTRQRFLHRFKEENLTIRENGIVYEFEKGRLKALRGFTSQHPDIMTILCGRREDSDEDPRFHLDRANIVYSWIHNEKNECEYYFTDEKITPSKQ